MRMLAIVFLLLSSPGLALAANCKRNGNVVTCDDGRTGIFTGDAIIWPDGTRSSSAKASERDHRAQGFGACRAGRVRRLARPARVQCRSTIRTAPHKRDCAVLDAVNYCF